MARGDWDVRLDGLKASGEIEELARAFETMTSQLVDQRERLVQAERVAAWRELARRLAHELKNPLFPLRITVDNLRRSKSLTAAEFDEVFDESIATLLTSLSNLDGVVGRFSDFARMPAPDFATVSPNELVKLSVQLFARSSTHQGSLALRWRSISTRRSAACRRTRSSWVARCRISCSTPSTPCRQEER